MQANPQTTALVGLICTRPDAARSRCATQMASAKAAQSSLRNANHGEWWTGSIQAEHSNMQGNAHCSLIRVLVNGCMENARERCKLRVVAAELRAGIMPWWSLPHSEGRCPSKP